MNDLNMVFESVGVYTKKRRNILLSWWNEREWRVALQVRNQKYYGTAPVAIREWYGKGNTLCRSRSNDISNQFMQRP